MAFNSYYLNILLRILLISATNFGFFYFLLKGDRFFTVMFLGILATAGNGILLAVMALGKDGWNLLGLKSLSDAGTFLFSMFLIAAGLLVFEYFSRRSKRTGVELTTIFTEIPPD